MDLEVDGFTPIEIIGRGGSATVYRAREHAFDREVALKVFDLEFGEAGQQRFTRELRAIGRLGEAHHAIALVFATGVTRRNNPYLSMRYYPGGSLQATVKRLGPVDVADALVVAELIGGALDAAHHAGILHRDVKPANVLLDGKHLAVLTDFGIGSFVEAAGDTSTSMSMMTPAYASPERIEGAQATIASDVYSLAATLWAALAGRVPHASTTGDSLATIIHRIIGGDIQPLDRTDVPDRVERALRRGLEQDPALRPASAAELVAELTGRLDRLMTSAPVEGAVPRAVPPIIASEVSGDGGSDVDVTVLKPRAPLSEAGAPALPPLDGPELLAGEDDPGGLTAASAAVLGPAANLGTTDPSGAPPESERSSSPRWSFVAAAVLAIGALVAGLMSHYVFSGKTTSAQIATKVEGKVVDRVTTTIMTTESTSTTDITMESTTSGPTTSVDTSSTSAASTTPEISRPPSYTVPTTKVVVGPHPTTPTIVRPQVTATDPKTTPPPPAPRSIECDKGTAPLTFSPGLASSKWPAVFTFLNDATKSGFSGCVDSQSRIVTGAFHNFTLNFDLIDCFFNSAAAGDGSGTIMWSDGSSSQAKLHVSLAGGFGSAKWTITSGAFVGAQATSSVTIDLAPRNWDCNPKLTQGMFNFDGISLKS